MELYATTVEEGEELPWSDQVPLDSKWKRDARKTKLKAGISGLFLKIKRETVQSSMKRATVKKYGRDTLGVELMRVSDNQMWNQGKDT